MSLSNELKELAELREAGILTDAEFEQQKQKLLASTMPPPSPSPTVVQVATPIPLPTPPTSQRDSFLHEASRPDNYMFQSILVTLFCCLPLGIVCIIKASQVSSAYNSGNYDLAFERSLETRTWVNISTIVGFLSICMSCVFSAAIR